MEFTGERYMTTEGGVMAYEHWHRYAHVARWVQGKRVLDAACGEGYGSAFLARTAASVLGVDIDPQAVDYASSFYGDIANVSYKHTDILALKPEDGQFEVIVSFETLEHVPDSEALMDAFKRLLVPGGLLIISTPDKDIYSGKYGHDNEFHVRELTAEEFEATCRARFKTVRILGQKGYVTSVIGDRTDAGGKVDLFGGTPDGPTPGVPSILEAVYLIAFCSDAKIQPEPGATTFFIDNNPSVQDERSVIEGWAQSLKRELQDLKTSFDDERDRSAQKVDGLERALQTSQAAVGKYEADNSRLDGLADRLQGIEQRLSSVDDLFSRMSGKIDQSGAVVAARIDDLQGRLEKLAPVTGMMEGLETLIDRMDASAARTAAAIDGQSKENAALFNEVTARILNERARAQQAHQSRLSKLAQDMATVSRAVDQDRVYFASLLIGLQKSVDTLAAPVQSRLKAGMFSPSDGDLPAVELAPLRVILKEGGNASPFWKEVLDHHQGRPRPFRKRRAKPDRDRLAHLVLQSGLLAPEWYSAQVGRPLSDVDAVWHFVTEGVAKNLSPNPLFDPQWYLNNNYDVDIAEVPAFLHYVANGWQENRAPHPLFDPEFYRLQTPVAGEPLSHFLRQRGHESDPHANFSVSDYRSQRPDLAAPEINPLAHYIVRGRAEGLLTLPSRFVESV